MGREDRRYKVYMHVNKTNGKIYVGMTRQRVQDRWDNGEGYKQCPKFYNAIKKYGWDGFTHVVYKSGLTCEEAEELERKLIKMFHTNGKYGYNIESGGNYNKHIGADTRNKLKEINWGERNPNARTVFQYDDNRILINVWHCISEAARQTGTCRRSIHKCCKKERKHAGGFRWAYADGD